LEKQPFELVQDAIVLRPEEPAASLALILWNEYHLEDLARDLAIRYLERAINSERRKARPRPEQTPLFPDIPDLPTRIITPEGKRPLLARSTATEIRTYVKSLNAKHRDRIAGLQAVLEHMEKYTRTNRGLTASEVAKLEAEG
jgi:hypothetical protein